MLGKVFKRGKSKASTGIATSRRASETTAETVNVDEIVAASSMNRSKRQLYKFQLPDNEQGFDDLLKEHVEGNRFQYVALSGKEGETYAARVRRLVTFSPKIGKEMLPASRVPLIKLIEETEQFNLSMIIPKKGKSYIRLSSVSGIYVPLVSALSDFTTVKFSLHDTRLLRDTCVQSVCYNSNITEKVELSLDYCIPRTSASKITLNIHREQAFLIEGEEWGTVQLQIRLEESDFPYANNLKEVTSVMSMPPALLEDYKTNPNHIDTTLTEAQRRQIRSIYESGDIADENEPITEHRRPVKYQQSSQGVKIKGHDSKKSFGEGWEHVKNFRQPLVSGDQISEEPEKNSNESTGFDYSLFDKIKGMNFEDVEASSSMPREKGKEIKDDSAVSKKSKGVTIREFDI